MPTTSRGHVAICLLLCSSLGCASTYVPRPSPRISLVMDGGTYAYVRDGKRYAGGIMGGDIKDAVQGNLQAEDYAQQYKTGMTAAFALTLVGVAGAVGGLVLLTSDATHVSSGQSIPPTGGIIIASGLVVELIGSIVALNAQPHLYDAINAYNDGLLEQSRAPTAP